MKRTEKQATKWEKNISRVLCSRIYLRMPTNQYNKKINNKNDKQLNRKLGKRLEQALPDREYPSGQY